jgi:hypothetical protein
MAIQASCQMTGVSAIQYFSPQIFAQIGIPTSRSLLFQAVNAIIAFAGTTVCILTIDGVGRRPLQICGHLFLCATFVINAVIIKVFPTTSNNTSAHWAFVVITWLFNFGQSKSFRYKFRLLTIVYSVLPHEWTSKLGCTSRIVRNSNALERRLLGCNDLFRFQHHDRPSNSNRNIFNRLGESSPALTC